MSSVSGCLDDLERAVADLPVGGSAPVCRELAERLMGVIDRAEAVLAGWVGRVDENREAQAAGHPSTAAWLRTVGGMRDGRAKERLALARQLPRLAETARRLAGGELAAGYATVIAQAVARLGDDDVPAAERLLLERVEDGWSVRQVARYADRIHDAVAVRDGAEPEPEDGRRGYAHPWLRLDASLDGGAYVKGWLDAEHAAAWRAVLDPLAKPAGEADDRDHAERLADAAYTVFTEGGRHWDAVFVINEDIGFTSEAAADGGGTVSDRAGSARLCDGTPLPAARARQLALNAGISALILGRDGLPLYLGRTVRLVTPHQRRVIEALYPTCSVRGCDIPARLCEIDHITAWALGGGTDITNLAPKCGFHNRFKANHPERLEERHIGGRWDTVIHPAEPPPRHATLRQAA